MTKPKTILTILASFVFFATIRSSFLWAQNEYNPKIPTPQSVIGHEVGERFTHFYQAEQFYKSVAQTSDRVRLIKYGETYEGRTLYLLFISSPDNLRQLETIRQNILQLNDPRKTNATTAENLAKSTPPICWLSYNVHGNESSSAEAALQVVYRLAAGEDAETKFILDNAVVIIDPLVNPDGRERYVNYFEQTMGRNPNPDINAAEHSENWPGGRFNHYLFDLNRDWAWQTQRESQARIKMYLQWNPQVHVDYHEMGAESTYYFPPNALPINTNVPPQVIKWLKAFGEANAKAFDAHGWQYFTHEGFDLFYPAYGDSWPAFNGAVGMTYEQAGGGGAGSRVKLRDDTFLTLKDRVAHHVATSFATLATTARNRVDLLRDYYQGKQEAVDQGLKGPVRAYLIPPGPDAERIASLVNLLISQGIEVSRAPQSFSAEGIRDYFGTVATHKDFPAGTYIVNLAQPLGRLARALLEPEASLKDKFFYDITAWSAPLAFGVDTFFAEKTISTALEPVKQVTLEGSRVVGGKAVAAYVFEWNTNSAARLLGRLLKEDVKASVAIKPFTIQGKAFAQGTIIIPVIRNKEDLHDKLAAYAGELHVAVFAQNSLLAQSGIDLGSNHVRPIRKPKIAVAMNTPVSPSEYGAIWNLFDNKFQIDFTPIKVDQLRSADLREYNVLIFPDDSGTGRGYTRVVDRGTIDKLKAWVRDGGTFIGIRGGAVFATEKRSGLTSVTYRYVIKRDDDARVEEEKAAQPPPGSAGAKPAEASAPPAARDEKSSKEKEEKELAEKLMTWEQKEEKQETERIPGALMKIQLDNTEPLAFGYGKEIVVANLTSPILALTSKGDNVGYYPKENFRVSGFITEENLKKLPNTGYLIRETLGRGHVVLYADDPNFRSFWEGTSRLFLNSIFFGAIDHPGIR